MQEGLIISEKLKSQKIYQATSTNKLGNMVSVDESNSAIAEMVKKMGLDLTRISLFLLTPCNATSVVFVNRGIKKGLRFLNNTDTEINRVKNFQINQKLAVQIQGVDAAIVQLPNIFLGVLHSDNAPVILYDKVSLNFALVNVDFLGAFSNLVTRVISCMQNWQGVNPKNIIAYIGPCVSDEFGIERSKKWSVLQKEYQLSADDRFNLKHMINQQLIDCRVSEIEISPFFTDKEEDLFYSDSLNGEESNGEKNLTLIGF